MNVPFLDLQAINLSQAAELEAAFKRAGLRLVHPGPETAGFEAAVCRVIATAQHGIGVANGLDAIFLILKATASARR
jgi:dTDP-4-amino-4,6-dideoxygalactose transaminase